MTASEISPKASEQDTYSASELDIPDKERSDYEAAVYQGWQGSLFKTSSPTAAPQVMLNSLLHDPCMHVSVYKMLCSPVCVFSAVTGCSCRTACSVPEQVVLFTGGYRLPGLGRRAVQ